MSADIGGGTVAGGCGPNTFVPGFSGMTYGSFLRVRKGKKPKRIANEPVVTTTRKAPMTYGRALQPIAYVRGLSEDYAGAWSGPTRGARGGTYWVNQKSGEKTYEDPTTGKAKAKQAVQSAGAAVGHAEHTISDAVKSAIGKLPKPAQKIIGLAWKATMSGYNAGRTAAEKSAVASGASPEKAAQIGKTLGMIDMMLSKGVFAGAVAAGASAGAASAAAFVVPAASIGYLAFSTAKNPQATLDLARKAVRKIRAAVRYAKGEGGDWIEAASKVAAEATDYDAFLACLAVAIDETKGSPDSSLEMAVEAESKLSGARQPETYGRRLVEMYAFQFQGPRSGRTRTVWTKSDLPKSILQSGAYQEIHATEREKRAKESQTHKTIKHQGQRVQSQEDVEKIHNRLQDVDFDVLRHYAHGLDIKGKSRQQIADKVRALLLLKATEKAAKKGNQVREPAPEKVEAEQKPTIAPDDLMGRIKSGETVTASLPDGRKVTLKPGKAYHDQPGVAVIGPDGKQIGGVLPLNRTGMDKWVASLKAEPSGKAPSALSKLNIPHPKGSQGGGTFKEKLKEIGERLKGAREKKEAPVEKSQWHTGTELPKGQTVASQLKEADSHLSRFSGVAAVKSSGWLSDGRYAVKATESMRKAAESMSDGGKPPVPIQNIIPNVKGPKGQFVAHRIGDGTHLVAARAGDRTQSFDANLVSNILKVHPGAEIHLGVSDKNLATFVKDGEIVGAIPPITRVGAGDVPNSVPSIGAASATGAKANPQPAAAPNPKELTPDPKQAAKERRAAISARRKEVNESRKKSLEALKAKMRGAKTQPRAAGAPEPQRAAEAAPPRAPTSPFAGDPSKGARNLPLEAVKTPATPFHEAWLAKEVSQKTTDELRKYAQDQHDKLASATTESAKTRIRNTIDAATRELNQRAGAAGGEPKAEKPASQSHMQAFKDVVGDEYASRYGDTFQRFFDKFDSLPEKEKASAYRSAEKRGRSFQSDIGAKVAYAGMYAGLTEDGMRNVLNRMKASGGPDTAPATPDITKKGPDTAATPTPKVDSTKAYIDAIKRGDQEGARKILLEGAKENERRRTQPETAKAQPAPSVARASKIPALQRLIEAARLKSPKTTAAFVPPVRKAGLPARTADTMSEAIALSSPNGNMSGRAKEDARRRLSKSLFGEGGIPGPQAPAQPSEAESLRTHAKQLRDLAARGMKPRAYLKQAEEMERKADSLSAPKLRNAPVSVVQPSPPKAATAAPKQPKPKAAPVAKESVAAAPSPASISREDMRAGYEDQTIFKDQEDGIVAIPKMFKYLKQKHPDLTIEQFHDELKKMEQEGNADLMILNEERLAKDPELSIRTPGGLKHYVYWHDKAAKSGKTPAPPAAQQTKLRNAPLPSSAMQAAPSLSVPPKPGQTTIPPPVTPARPEAINDQFSADASDPGIGFAGAIKKHFGDRIVGGDKEGIFVKTKYGGPLANWIKSNRAGHWDGQRGVWKVKHNAEAALVRHLRMNPAHYSRVEKPMTVGAKLRMILACR